MKGRHPKPAHLRQNRTKKAGAGIIGLDAGYAGDIPPIPNPDGRTWHELTLTGWTHAWNSPMASQWLETDVDALGRLALMWDEFYKCPDAKILAEIRLQESRFGLSPLDRSRLQWEVSRGEDAERRQRQKAAPKRTGADDPRAILMAVK